MLVFAASFSALGARRTHRQAPILGSRTTFRPSGIALVLVLLG